MEKITVVLLIIFIFAESYIYATIPPSYEELYDQIGYRYTLNVSLRIKCRFANGTAIYTIDRIIFCDNLADKYYPLYLDKKK